ncbi:acyl dehydratase [Actinomycetospora succinea]|uniref:Acyl dehydratase n=1 Tax=Actinomycetospora succinea TaxID=663603 RepID=A0A4R6VS98_9PSEU|nr:MaoC family dehydratase [Actinomycetospora succinea]TDQ62780.1 acyl dehydratase [Actinomycetospora succinea]
MPDPTDGAPRVGQRASRSREITRRDIELFTAISGDRNPLHYDEAFAAATRFGGIVVQGGVTTAVLNAVVAEDLPGPGSVFLQLDLRFLAPVRPGDVITGSVEVTSARIDKPITELAVRVTRDDTVVAVEGTAVCWTARPQPTAAPARDGTTISSATQRATPAGHGAGSPSTT